MKEKVSQKSEKETDRVSEAMKVTEQGGIFKEIQVWYLNKIKKNIF